MYYISKEFKVDSAHRVRTQNLISQHSSSNGKENKCKKIHGHTSKIVVTLKSKKLFDDNMVLDFNNLGFFKDYLNKYFDHKLIMDKDDDMFKVLFATIPNWIFEKDSYDYSEWIIEENGVMLFDMERISELNKERPFINEFLDSFTIVDFVPTAENYAKFFYNILHDYLTHNFNHISVDEVEYYETASSKAVYSND